MTRQHLTAKQRAKQRERQLKHRKALQKKYGRGTR